MRNILNKLILIFNIVLALTLTLSYALPYLSPKAFPLLAVLSLTVPVLIFINLFFLIYWIIRLKKYLLISFVSLLLGLSHVNSLYKIHGKVSGSIKNTITLLSYNVHSFNRYLWIDSKTIPQDISDFVKQNAPDIFCIQEFYDSEGIDFDQFAFKHQDFNNDNGELALVTFSKYPIINKGSLRFAHTPNNAIYSDIVVRKDTIRIYNIHLQSHKIDTRSTEFAKEASEKLLKQIEVSFEKQQHQTDILIDHIQSSPYKNIVMGDFNNTAYSYIYDKIISENLKDTFKEAGQGFGTTFDFDFFPVRIDFILVNSTFEVLEFQNFRKKYSDHYPIWTRVVP